MDKFEVPEIPARYLILWTLGITAVIASFWLLWRFQDVLLLFLTAVILSTAIRPIARWLEQGHIPKPAGILLIFALIGVAIALFAWFSLPLLTNQTTTVIGNLNEAYTSLHQSAEQYPNILWRRILFILPENPALNLGQEPFAMPNAELSLQANEGQGNQLMKILVQFVAVIIIAFYWTLEENHIKNSAFLLVPLNKRAGLRELVTEIETKVSGYLLGQGLLCLTIGILAFIAYLLIGLPNALLLAAFAGLLEAVPVVGPFLGAVPAIIVGLSISPSKALWVILATVIIQQLENSLLVPRVMNKTIGVRPLVTLMALLAFGTWFGILGALIALPLAAVIQLLLDRYILSTEDAYTQTGRGHLSVLRYETSRLVQDVRNQVRNKELVPSALTDELEDEVETIALDLESYLTRLGGE